MPLTSTLTTFGHAHPRLESVTLLYECVKCRIADVHVWDGAVLVQEFDGVHLRGSRLTQRDSDDVNPLAPAVPANSFPNTLRRTRRHPVFSAIGVSFLVRWHAEDLRVDSHDFQKGNFPASTVTIAAAGAQYDVASDIGSPFITGGLTEVTIKLGK